MKITLYTKPGCIPCKAVKKWLDKYELNYSVVDLSTDSEAKERIIDLGLMSTPITEVELDDYVEYIHGLAIEKLTKAIFTHA